MFPEAHGELDAATPFQLLIAVILSAQATDKGSIRQHQHFLLNTLIVKAYPWQMFQTLKTWSRPLAYIAVKLKTSWEQLRWSRLSLGWNSEDKDLLQTLPGVGRKTANVVLGDAFGIPGIAVDTHVERVSKRLQLVKQSATVTEVEEKLMKVVPEKIGSWRITAWFSLVAITVPLVRLNASLALFYPIVTLEKKRF